MKYLIKNAAVFIDNSFVQTDILICDGIIVDISKNIQQEGVAVFSFDNLFVFPGFTDVHVHLREPGFSYKENIETGTMAAAHGGYTSVCAMPNLKPCPDSLDNLEKELEPIRNSAKVHVYPYGTITKGEQGEELSDIEAMSSKVFGFSDDGRGVQSEEMMLSAMKKVKENGNFIAAHCEDNSLLHGGYIHDGEYAALHGHKGICSESEWKPIERDIALAKKSGCKYHVCHISCKESVELIRKAKADGVDISCETGPHYLTMNDMMLQENGRFKMNPPIRSESDRLALIEGIKDGTIDMIATDHAPHSAGEKSKGLEKSLMGVVGLETAFAVCYTKLVKTGVISLEKLIELLNVNARNRFGIGTEIAVGQAADLTVFDLDEEYEINPNDFLSMGKASPFTGEKVFGKCKLTMVGGRIVWQENLTEK
ncbi:MAG: dihydroorotase [Faecalibacterium sp.]|nr:dihydroorotase [Ruminococcus sp.]MCM1392661.1 dihydroorotase [Ruminococcus sp.]MCM1486312.1 dihydroorotase [Faecalibacterium sp.]